MRGCRFVLPLSGHGYHDTCLGENMDRCPHCQQEDKSRQARRFGRTPSLFGTLGPAGPAGAATVAATVSPDSTAKVTTQQDLLASTASSVQRLDRVLRQESRMPSRMEVFEAVGSAFDDEAVLGTVQTRLALGPVQTEVAASERRVPLTTRKPGMPTKLRVCEFCARMIITIIIIIIIHIFVLCFVSGQAHYQRRPSTQ
jgi:hypothetical protein